MPGGTEAWDYEFLVPDYLKFTDIAQTLGLPLNTALGRVHKALKKLRQLMDVA